MGGFNGSGIYTRFYNWVNDKNAGIPITASRVDTEDDGYATGLSTCVLKDGTQILTANIPWSGFKITGYGTGSAPNARSDVPSLSQVQDGLLNWVAAGGTADALTATYAPALTALADGDLCFVRATTANLTTTPTFAPSGLTARTVTKLGGAALVASEWVQYQELILRYNLANTRWELLNPRKVANADVVGLGTAALKNTGTSGNNVPLLDGANTVSGVETHTATVAMSGAAFDEAAYGTIAAATTTDLSTVATNAVTVTGNSPITITSWGSLPSGGRRTVRFTGTGAHVISHNGNTNNITGANITVAQNDFAVIRGLGGGVCLMEDYVRYSGSQVKGGIAQVVNTETGAVATGSTLIPYDDTDPQNAEGDQFMSLAITPTNAASTLIIEVLANFSNTNGTSEQIIGALFQDATASAIAVGATSLTGVASPSQLSLIHKMAAGTTSATTFKFRMGSKDAGTMTFNGVSGGRLFGGAFASTITITEVLP